MDSRYSCSHDTQVDYGKRKSSADKRSPEGFEKAQSRKFEENAGRMWPQYIPGSRYSVTAYSWLLLLDLIAELLLCLENRWKFTLPMLLLSLMKASIIFTWKWGASNNITTWDRTDHCGKGWKVAKAKYYIFTNTKYKTESLFVRNWRFCKQIFYSAVVFFPNFNRCWKLFKIEETKTFNTEFQLTYFKLAGQLTNIIE